MLFSMNFFGESRFFNEISLDFCKQTSSKCEKLDVQNFGWKSSTLWRLWRRGWGFESLKFSRNFMCRPYSRANSLDLNIQIKIFHRLSQPILFTKYNTMQLDSTIFKSKVFVEKFLNLPIWPRMINVSIFKSHKFII